MILRAGYEEVSHTADRAIKAWGATLPDLMHQAALGMYSLMDIKPIARADLERHLTIDVDEPETLLVGFLSALLTLLETENLVVSTMEARLSDHRMEIKLNGRRLKNVRIEIKAVTYHDLRVLETGNGLETTIVFDV